MIIIPYVPIIIRGHAGKWKDCPICRKDFDTEMYLWSGQNEYNFEKLPNPPAFKPIKCAKCGRIIHLGNMVIHPKVCLVQENYKRVLPSITVIETSIPLWG